MRLINQHTRPHAHQARPTACSSSRRWTATTTLRVALLTRCGVATVTFRPRWHSAVELHASPW